MNLIDDANKSKENKEKLNKNDQIIGDEIYRKQTVYIEDSILRKLNEYRFGGKNGKNKREIINIALEHYFKHFDK